MIRSNGLTANGRYGPRKLASRILKPKKQWNGRLIVNLQKRPGLPQYPFVHRLVAEAWIPNPDSLPEVNHIDGDPANNHVDNLEWCTHQYNHQHRVRSLGIDNLASKAKLTLAQKVQVMVATGTRDEIGKRFGVSAGRVWQIWKGL